MTEQEPNPNGSIEYEELTATLNDLFFELEANAEDFDGQPSVDITGVFNGEIDAKSVTDLDLAKQGIRFWGISTSTVEGELVVSRWAEFGGDPDRQIVFTRQNGSITAQATLRNRE